jgi:hypothetical protein
MIVVPAGLEFLVVKASLDAVLVSLRAKDSCRATKGTCQGYKCSYLDKGLTARPKSHDAAFERAFEALNHGDVRGFVSESGRECSSLGL